MEWIENETLNMVLLEVLCKLCLQLCNNDLVLARKLYKSEERAIPVRCPSQSC